jgi:hypothetical protein
VRKPHASHDAVGDECVEQRSAHSRRVVRRQKHLKRQKDEVSDGKDFMTRNQRKKK